MLSLLRLCSVTTLYPGVPYTSLMVSALGHQAKFISTFNSYHLKYKEVLFLEAALVRVTSGQDGSLLTGPREPYQIMQIQGLEPAHPL